MFTPEGELREEFQDLRDAEAPKATAEPRTEETAQVDSQPTPMDRAPAGEASMGQGPMGQAPVNQGPINPAAGQSPAEEIVDEPTESGAAFYDLVAMLAQAASVYLRQASQQLEQRGELLEMTRMHIDLLIVLQRKTRGNLNAEESAMLEDAIYRLRMAFVEVGG